ncbi:MAG: hypothetical protein AAFV27_01605 [Pseudomonadota bacterium]
MTYTSTHPAPTPILSLAKPVILDRLGIVTILASLYYIQHFSHTAFYYEADLLSARNIPALGIWALGIAGILLGRAHVLLFASALCMVLLYALKAPSPSNSQIMAAFFSLIVVLSYAQWWLQGRAGGRDGLFDLIAGPGRWLLAIMYFYGIYHKINWDFLDPEVSCGAILYNYIMYPYPFDMANWTIGKYAAIYTTFIAEGIAMLLLFSSKYKKIGFIIGIPFHMAIGFSGYAYYLNFCTIVLVTYTLFIPRESMDNAKAWLVSIFGSEDVAAWIGRLFIVGGVVVTFGMLGAFSDWHAIRTEQPTFKYAFAVYAALFYAFVVVFVPWRTNSDLPIFFIKPLWMMIIPIVFFINGASPYLGLKTESSIAMYSNLVTERGETNHLFHGVLPFGTTKYQEDIVIPDQATRQAMVKHFRQGGDAAVRFEFDRFLAKNPDKTFNFTYNGEARTNDATWENTYLNASLLERRFLEFRAIEFGDKKLCTH